MRVVVSDGKVEEKKRPEKKDGKYQQQNSYRVPLDYGDHVIVYYIVSIE